MSADPVFLLSTGRSGSTLLQRLLNCHHDLVVWGEHNGFVGDLSHGFQMMQTDPASMLTRSPEENWAPGMLVPRFNDPRADLSWANPWSAPEYADLVRRFLESYFAAKVLPGQRWGFKEIRYNWPGVMEMLRTLYPQGQFLLLRRNALAIARSKGKAWNRRPLPNQFSLAERTSRIDETLRETREHFKQYDAFMARHPEACTHVQYEELVASPEEEMTRLLEVLRLDPARYDWDLARRVLATPA